MTNYDLIVVGSGAAGMMSAIVAARLGKKVLLLEKLPKLGSKLKATGGGRCNLTNTLENEEFMAHFGKNGRFMTHSLDALNQQKLREFFKSIGVDTHAPDGVRVFPTTHNSDTIIKALLNELNRLKIKILCSQKVEKIVLADNHVAGVNTQKERFYSSYVVVATGGLGYPSLGAEGDGYILASEVGHKVTKLYPAMLALKVSENWVAHARADTIAKAEICIDLAKYKKLRACGDLIFTKDGIRGPVVLDFAREITPLLEKYDKVPLLINLTKGMNEQQIRDHLKDNSKHTILHSLSLILPQSIATQFCKICDINQTNRFSKIAGKNRDDLIKILATTPLTVIGHDGFKSAMITRGGISLKEICPKTLKSKLVDGLYFCGEIVDLDGPCGGFNLQWSFSSGYVAGHLGENSAQSS